MKTLNKKKKSLTKTIFYLPLALFITFISCKSDDTPTDCGCNSSIIFTIQESDEQIGYLYKNTDNSNENIPSHNYGVYYSEPNCSNCINTYFICNDTFLNGFGEIPEYPGIEVQFSGHSKKVCQGVWAPADYTYNYLTLTQIE